MIELDNMKNTNYYSRKLDNNIQMSRHELAVKLIKMMENNLGYIPNRDTWDNHMLNIGTKVRADDFLFEFGITYNHALSIYTQKEPLFKPIDVKQSIELVSDIIGTKNLSKDLYDDYIDLIKDYNLPKIQNINNVYATNVVDDINDISPKINLYENENLNNEIDIRNRVIYFIQKLFPEADINTEITLENQDNKLGRCDIVSDDLNLAIECKSPDKINLRNGIGQTIVYDQSDKYTYLCTYLSECPKHIIKSCINYRVNFIGIEKDFMIINDSRNHTQIYT